jgi:hypothetical protein
MTDLGKKVWKRPVINEAPRPDVSNIDFAGEIIVKRDAECELARRVWNASIDRYPAAILRCSGGALVAYSSK